MINTTGINGDIPIIGTKIKLKNIPNNGENGRSLDISENDLNEIKDNGFYSGNKLKNSAPGYNGQFGYVFIIGHHSLNSFLIQLFFTQNSINEMWVRNCSDNVWTSWKKIC